MPGAQEEVSELMGHNVTEDDEEIVEFTHSAHAIHEYPGLRPRCKSQLL
jgi:hypothetical protein